MTRIIFWIVILVGTLLHSVARSRLILARYTGYSLACSWGLAWNSMNRQQISLLSKTEHNISHESDAKKTASVRLVLLHKKPGKTG